VAALAQQQGVALHEVEYGQLSKRLEKDKQVLIYPNESQ
jgi:hypothetical protein